MRNKYKMQLACLPKLVVSRRFVIGVLVASAIRRSRAGSIGRPRGVRVILGRSHSNEKAEGNKNL